EMAVCRARDKFMTDLPCSSFRFCKQASMQNSMSWPDGTVDVSGAVELSREERQAADNWHI
ncbi:MAG: hypothetical protein RR958_21325, partial [Pseudomonas sp.]